MNQLPLPPGIQTKVFVLEPHALIATPKVLKKYFPGLQPWLVADDNTWKVAGQELTQILTQAGFQPFTPYIFPGHPVLHAEERHVETLQAALPQGAVPIAVGGGTINDLVKRLAGVRNIHYLCVPTAPSVDGFTSSGAALLSQGLKRTLPCPAPYAVVADTDILEHAPAPMIASGYADLAAKIPAGADWIIADELQEQAIRQDVWDLVQPDLRTWLGPNHTIQQVFLGLAATGYAMQLFQDSRPASGMEHLCSHVWEMEGLTYQGETVSHGFKVAIGSLIAMSFMEKIQTMTATQVYELAEAAPSETERLAQIRELTKRGCYGNDVEKIAMGKFLTGWEMQDQREQILFHWEAIKERIGKQLMPYQQFKNMLKDAGCPTTPQEIGLSDEQLKHGILTAQLIRHRYTILDLLFEAGVLKHFVNTLQL